MHTQNSHSALSLYICVYWMDNNKPKNIKILYDNYVYNRTKDELWSSHAGLHTNQTFESLFCFRKFGSGRCLFVCVLCLSYTLWCVMLNTADVYIRRWCSRILYIYIYIRLVRGMLNLKNCLVLYFTWTSLDSEWSPSASMGNVRLRMCGVYWPYNVHDCYCWVYCETARTYLFTLASLT